MASFAMATLVILFSAIFGLAVGAGVRLYMHWNKLSAVSAESRQPLNDRSQQLPGLVSANPVQNSTSTVPAPLAPAPPPPGSEFSQFLAASATGTTDTRSNVHAPAPPPPGSEFSQFLAASATGTTDTRSNVHVQETKLVPKTNDVEDTSDSQPALTGFDTVQIFSWVASTGSTGDTSTQEAAQDVVFVIPVKTAVDFKMVYAELAKLMSAKGISPDQVAADPEVSWIAKGSAAVVVHGPEDLENVELPGEMKFVLKVQGVNADKTPELLY